MNTNKKSITSNEFLKLAFQKTPPVDDYTNNSTIKKLNEIFADHTVKIPNGGASGASVYLLIKNKELKYVFKYSVQASKNFNKPRQRSNSTNSTSSNISTSSTSSLNVQLKKSKYNGEQKYVRTVREIYLSKKFTEAQEKEQEKITPNAIEIGFLKNFTISNENNKFIIKINTKSNKDTYIPFILQEGAKGTELENPPSMPIKMNVAPIVPMIRYRYAAIKARRS